jgi:hypothetical protein
MSTTKLSSLEQAMINLMLARDSSGLAVMLCSQPTSIDRVRSALYVFAMNFRPEARWMNDGEEAGCRNLSLLASLLAEHLKASKEKAA